MCDRKLIKYYVFGTIVSPVSLKKSCQVLRNAFEFTNSECYVYTSRYDGRESLKIHTDTCDFESERLERKTSQGWQHLFNGEIIESTDFAIATIEKIADTLVEDKN